MTAELSEAALTFLRERKAKAGEQFTYSEDMDRVVLAELERGRYIKSGVGNLGLRWPGYPATRYEFTRKAGIAARAAT